MSMARGAALSFGCAAVGAAVWAGLSIAADMRLGLLAIVVGGLAGFGMGYGSKARGGVWVGVLAALIALATILVSRGVVATSTASRLVRENAPAVEEVAFEQHLTEVHDRMASEGAEMSETDEAVPPEVMLQAQREWDRMPATDKAIRMNTAEEQHRVGVAAATGAMTVVAFLVDFGLFGFVWVGLGMFAAYKAGSARAVKTENGWVREEDAPAVVAETVSAAPAMPRGFPTPSAADDEDPLERLKRLRAKEAAAKAEPAGDAAEESQKKAA